MRPNLRTKRKLTPKQMVLMYRRGGTHRQIAAKAGVSRARVYQLLHREGVRRGDSPRFCNKDAAVAKLHSDGLRDLEICEALLMSVARVKLARKRLNISAHPPWTKRPEDRQKAWDKPWIHRSAPRFARLWCAGKSTANIAAIMKLSRPQTMLLCVMSRKLLGVEQVPYRRFSKKAS